MLHEVVPVRVLTRIIHELILLWIQGAKPAAVRLRRTARALQRRRHSRKAKQLKKTYSSNLGFLFQTLFAFISSNINWYGFEYV